jgi:hypothetical protein
MEPVDLVEGWTERVDFTLYADGAAIDLTGRTVTIHVRDKNGDDPGWLGSVAIVTAASGQVGYTPNSADLVATEGPYTVRFKIMSDGYFVPNKEPMVWLVRGF